MEKNTLMYYCIIGLGLILLLPAADAAGENLQWIATFLVFGYWSLLAFCIGITLCKNLFTTYGAKEMLYNLWLFLSLACVAVGVLAIVDDGLDKSRWALWLIVYGTTVGYFNRKEL